MGVTLKTVLDAGANALPAKLEAKFPKLPKISPQMLKFDKMIPAGPTIWPAPPAKGFPVFAGLPMTGNYRNLPPPSYVQPQIKQVALAEGITTNTAKVIPNVYASR
jgi:hypothetical protein